MDKSSCPNDFTMLDCSRLNQPSWADLAGYSARPTVSNGGNGPARGKAPFQTVETARFRRRPRFTAHNMAATSARHFSEVTYSHDRAPPPDVIYGGRSGRKSESVSMPGRSAPPYLSHRTALCAITARPGNPAGRRRFAASSKGLRSGRRRPVGTGNGTDGGGMAP